MSDPQNTAEAGAGLGRMSAGLQVVAWLTLAVGCAVALVGIVILPVNQLTQGGGQVRVQLADPDATYAPIDSVFLGEELPRGVSMNLIDDQVELAAFRLPTELVLLTTASLAWASLAFLVGCWMLFGLLRTIGSGRPFDDANPRRLVVLAGAVAIGGMGIAMFDNWATTAVIGYLGVGELPLAVPDLFEVAPLIYALFILALALAFRYGRAIQHDVVGLV